MRTEGFEALADGTLLLAVLLVASSVVLALARPSAPDVRAIGLREAEDVRVALFQTTMDGLGYRLDGEFAEMPNETTVETFLRVEVHLRSRGPTGADFTAANARVADITGRLLRPGWRFSLQGVLENGSVLVAIPEGTTLPGTYYLSAWTYPSLDGSPEGTRLLMTAWPSPPR